MTALLPFHDEHIRQSKQCHSESSLWLVNATTMLQKDEVEAYECGGSHVKALFPLSSAVLSKVVVLLSCTLLGWEEHATPHGEVLAAHSNAAHTDHDNAHPLEGIHRWNVCTSDQLFNTATLISVYT